MFVWEGSSQGILHIRRGGSDGAFQAMAAADFLAFMGEGGGPDAVGSEAVQREAPLLQAADPGGEPAPPTDDDTKLAGLPDTTSWVLPGWVGTKENVPETAGDLRYAEIQSVPGVSLRSRSFLVLSAPEEASGGRTGTAPPTGKAGRTAAAAIVWEMQTVVGPSLGTALSIPPSVAEDAARSAAWERPRSSAVPDAIVQFKPAIPTPAFAMAKGDLRHDTATASLPELTMPSARPVAAASGLLSATPRGDTPDQPSLPVPVQGSTPAAATSEGFVPLGMADGEVIAQPASRGAAPAPDPRAHNVAHAREEVTLHAAEPHMHAAKPQPAARPDDAPAEEIGAHLSSSTVPPRSVPDRPAPPFPSTGPAPQGSAERPAPSRADRSGLPERLHVAMDRSAAATAPTPGSSAILSPSQGAAPFPAGSVARGMPDRLEELEKAIPLAHAEKAAVASAGEKPSTWNAPSPADSARNVSHQLVAAVSSGAEGAYEIQLSPEELGRVTVTLQVTDDAVVLAIQADRQETLDLMRRHADILQREFRESGFASLSFSFGNGSADGRPSRGPASAASFDDTVAGSMAPQPGRESGRVPVSSRLDLRL